MGVKGAMHRHATQWQREYRELVTLMLMVGNGESHLQNPWIISYEITSLWQHLKLCRYLGAC